MKSRLTVGMAAANFFGSARFASAVATSSMGIGALSWTLHHLIGWAGLIAVLSVQVALGLTSVWARRASLERASILPPISLLAYLTWSTLSAVWSQYQWVTVGALAYLAAFTVLAIHIALVRDTIQVVRAFGDVLRVVLAVSLALEVLSGILIDSPINFLGIGAHLAEGGPISGLLGNRNDLGLLAVIGGVSFVIEWRTKSIRRDLAIGSLVMAGITLFFTRSSIAWGTALVAVLVLAVLFGLRRIPAERRQFWQFAALAPAVVAVGAAWLLRSPIVHLLNAGGDLNYRLRLWQEMWMLLRLHPVEGWGWIGQWNASVPPYMSFGAGSGRASTSGVNAYLDVWFQLGFIGLVVFVGLLGLAFARSWLLAARQRSVIFTWPAVVLAALLTFSLAESGVLTELGWMTFVICCVNASQSLSWRKAFQRPLEQEPL